MTTKAALLAALISGVLLSSVQIVDAQTNPPPNATGEDGAGADIRSSRQAASHNDSDNRREQPESDG